MQKVFVTGASGFVGLQLVTRLKSEGISVRCLVRKRKHPGHVRPRVPLLHSIIIFP